MIKEIKELFHGSGIKVVCDKEGTYFTFLNNKGINCEFYECNGSGYLSSSYVVDGQETQMDLHYKDDADELLRVVKQILNPVKEKKIKAPKAYPKLRLVV